MKITGYESENGNVTAITVTDETRGFYDKRFVPERPHGEWKEMWHSGRDVYSCSECFETYKMPIMYNFCPNCGADMREGEAE